MPGECKSDLPEVAGAQVSEVTCKFTAYREKWRASVGGFAARGAPQNPQYVVKLDSYSGSARLERHGEFWPETFVMKISGRRDTILIVTFIPDGYGEMYLSFVPGEKWVSCYDARGKHLDRPTGLSFLIETEETAHGVDVQVTLPQAARSARHLDVNYFSTSW
jgi:hypothetical protein